jgi:hypothetical protein
MCGCGLLTVPYLETFPRENVQRVLVFDQETRQPLDDARVSFVMARWENWFPPQCMPRWGTSGSPEEFIAAETQHGPQGEVTSWDAVRADGDAFEFRPETKWAATTVCFPIGLPLGGILYRTYDGAVVVSAPNHLTVWFSNWSSRERPPFSRDNRGPEAHLDLGSKEAHVFLPRPATETPTSGPASR